LHESAATSEFEDDPIDEDSEDFDLDNVGSDDVDFYDQQLDESSDFGAPIDDEDFVKIDWYNKIYIKLGEIIDQCNGVPQVKQNVLSSYALWCAPHFIVPYKDLFQEGGITYWTSVSNSGSRISGLAPIAIQILQIPASEASCERTISEIRRLMGMRRTRMSPKTILNLLILSKKRKNERYMP